MDKPKTTTFQAIRWPSINKVIVGGDPTIDMPEPGDIVTIDTVKYRVVSARAMKQFSMDVEEYKPNG